MSKLVTKQNNRSFKELFDHVEPFVMDKIHFIEYFIHTDPPVMTFDFLESFDS